MVVMSEKVELLELVEQRELTIGQLSGETETIGQNSYYSCCLSVCVVCVCVCVCVLWQGSTSCCTRPRERL